MKQDNHYTYAKSPNYIEVIVVHRHVILTINFNTGTKHEHQLWANITHVCLFIKTL